MKVPCEVIHWQFIPAVSAELAKELVSLGMPQVEIAKSLGVTPAAVSQYMKKKRGREIGLSAKVREEIKKLAKKIKAGKVGGCSVVSGVCAICAIARSSGSICGAHRRSSKVSSCSVCTGG